MQLHTVCHNKFKKVKKLLLTITIVRTSKEKGSICNQVFSKTIRQKNATFAPVSFSGCFFYFNIAAGVLLSKLLILVWGFLTFGKTVISFQTGSLYVKHP